MRKKSPSTVAATRARPARKRPAYSQAPAPSATAATGFHSQSVTRRSTPSFQSRPEGSHMGCRKTPSLSPRRNSFEMSTSLPASRMFAR